MVESVSQYASSLSSKTCAVHYAQVLEVPLFFTLMTHLHDLMGRFEHFVQNVHDLMGCFEHSLRSGVGDSFLHLDND